MKHLHEARLEKDDMKVKQSKTNDNHVMNNTHGKIMKKKQHLTNDIY